MVATCSVIIWTNGPQQIDNSKTILITEASLQKLSLSPKALQYNPGTHFSQAKTTGCGDHEQNGSQGSLVWTISKFQIRNFDVQNVTKNVEPTTQDSIVSTKTLYPHRSIHKMWSFEKKQVDMNRMRICKLTTFNSFAPNVTQWGLPMLTHVTCHVKPSTANSAWTTALFLVASSFVGMSGPERMGSPISTFTWKQDMCIKFYMRYNLKIGECWLALSHRCVSPHPSVAHAHTLEVGEEAHTRTRTHACAHTRVGGTQYYYPIQYPLFVT